MNDAGDINLLFIIISMYIDRYTWQQNIIAQDWKAMLGVVASRLAKMILQH